MHKPTVMREFHPYVGGTLPTKWYRSLERKGKAWTMWTMWFVYYMHINQLYSVFSNLAVYTGTNQTSLVINRMEWGLHSSPRVMASVRRRRNVNLGLLLTVWKSEYVIFPKRPVRLDWDGTRVPNNRKY